MFFFEVPEKMPSRIFQESDRIHQISYIAELEFGSPEEEIARICRAIRMTESFVVPAGHLTPSSRG